MQISTKCMKTCLKSIQLILGQKISLPILDVKNAISPRIVFIPDFYFVNVSTIKLKLDQTLTSDAPSGTGLIFIAVADAVSDLPGSYILSVIFFFMVILLGLGSMIGTAEGVVTPIFDALRSKGYELLKSERVRFETFFVFKCILFSYNIKKPLLVAAMSVIMFSAGIVLTTPAGNYWLDIIDTSTGGIPLLIVGLFQFMVVGWGFGGRRWLRKVFKTFFHYHRHNLK